MERAEQMANAMKNRQHQDQRDPHSPTFAPQVQVADKQEAARIADQPRLTGDPEWDAVELAETDASREPISDEFLGKYARRRVD